MASPEPHRDRGSDVAVEAEHPRSRYLVTAAARALVHARRLGGDRVWDAITKRQFA